MGEYSKERGGHPNPLDPSQDVDHLKIGDSGQDIATHLKNLTNIFTQSLYMFLLRDIHE